MMMMMYDDIEDLMVGRDGFRKDMSLSDASIELTVFFLLRPWCWTRRIGLASGVVVVGLFSWWFLVCCCGKM